MADRSFAEVAKTPKPPNRGPGKDGITREDLKKFAAAAAPWVIGAAVVFIAVLIVRKSTDKPEPSHFGTARDDLHNAKVHAKKSWFSFGDAAGEATRGAGEATQNQAARAHDAAQAGYEQARDTASNAYDSARDAASNAYSSARDAAHNAGSRVQDAYGSSVETIGEKVRGAGERLESHGSDVRPVEQKAGWKPW